MARVSLNWSRADLAKAAGVGVATVVRFETGGNVMPDLVANMRKALEDRRVKFVDNGPLKGAVVGGLRPSDG